MNKDTPLIHVCRRVIELCKRAGIKKYSSKYSNKLYTNYQHMVLLCLKQKCDTGYEAFIEEELVELPHIVEFLGLETVPHFTALQKFAQRIKQSILELVLLQTTARTGIKKLVLGQDGTGFKARKISHYYVMRLEYFKRKNKKKKRGRPTKKRKIKKYLYVQIMVELRTQMPIGFSVTRKPGNDFDKFIPVGKKVLKLGKDIRVVILDKGYDDQKIHEFIREVMNAKSIIPPRYENVAIHRTHGQYRKEMKKGYSKKEYHQRSKNETINSVVKRKWGQHTLALNWRNQNKELILRLIFYAARRFTSLQIYSKLIHPLKTIETLIFSERGFL